MGTATNPRVSSRSKGGRPKQAGDRYPSGKLRPAKPNANVVEVRQAFGLEKLGQKFTPIEVAFHRGWIDEETYWAAARYAALHRLAMSGAGAPQHANQNLPEVPNTVDVRALSFAALTDKEVSAIWDSAMGPERNPKTDEERQAKATRTLRDWNARMTPEQRSEVYDVCILDSFPQWIIQRAAGREGTSWERKRDILIAGLRNIARALRPATAIAQSAIDAAERESHPVSSSALPAGSVRRQFYVDEEGEPLFEVERVYRLRQRT